MNKFITYTALALLIPSLLLTAGYAYEMAIEEREWSFPRDHGSHPGFRTEWWYFTGHLRGNESVYGFELTFFRFSNRKRLDEFELESEWSPENIYLTHFTITDENRGEFYKYEKLGRGNLGLSGSSTETLDVWNGLYSARMNDDIIVINAVNPEVELKLSLHPRTDIVLNGTNGLSKKGPARGEASYYYSIPRMEGTGILSLEGNETKITTASVWMDREFFSIPRSDMSGWDWFAIQFKDGSNLMLYTLKDNNGEKSTFSSGTYVNAEGVKHILESDDFSVSPTEYWESERTGVSYPTGFNIEVPELELAIEVKATLKDQELVLEKYLKLNYWEGRALVTGTRKGDAYVELVGYDNEDTADSNRD